MSAPLLLISIKSVKNSPGIAIVVNTPPLGKNPCSPSPVETHSLVVQYQPTIFALENLSLGQPLLERREKWRTPFSSLPTFHNAGYTRGRWRPPAHRIWGRTTCFITPAKCELRSGAGFWAPRIDNRGDPLVQFVKIGTHVKLHGGWGTSRSRIPGYPTPGCRPINILELPVSATIRHSCIAESIPRIHWLLSMPG